eukprot:693476_1
MELKQRNQIIQDPQFQFDMDFQTGTRWVVDTNKQTLGHKEPLALRQALQQSQSKDVLLISPGEYTIHCEELFGIDKDLSLIGIGDDVVLKLESDISNESYEMHRSQLFFKNIHLEVGHLAGISKLSIINCFILNRMRWSRC